MNSHNEDPNQQRVAESDANAQAIRPRWHAPLLRTVTIESVTAYYVVGPGTDGVLGFHQAGS